ncbi:MAG: aryl-sulfate sulfotransferase [Chloroflexota bacterium]
MRYVIRIFTLIFIISVISIGNAQEEDIPAVGVMQSSDAVSDGYVLFSPSSSNIAYLIDNDGSLVHQWETETRLFNAYLIDNGDLLALTRFRNGDNFPAGGTGQVVRLSWDGEILWQYDFTLPDAQIHHDLAIMPNGHLLMLMWERIYPEQFAEYGIDPTIMPEDEPIFYDTIIQVDPQTNEIVWRWRTLDHGVQTINPDLANFGVPAANPNLIDLNYTHRQNRTADRTHINAIEYHPELNQILLSAHYQSEIWIVDYETEELVYRWGNPATYGRGLPENRQTFNQHNPTWLDNGNILIFNNGLSNSRPYSSVIEIVPPVNDDGTYDLLDGAAFAPFEPVWEYAPRDEDEFFARNISGAQRLANGNTFITDGPSGRLFEIDTNDTIVWEYINPIWFEPEEPRPTSIFRATRYLADYPAFEGRDLTPTAPISYELNLPTAQQN